MQEKQYEDIEILNKMDTGLAYIAVIISVIVFFYSLPFLFTHISQITAIPSSYIYLNISLSVPVITFLIVISLVLVLLSFTPLIYSSNEFTSLDRKTGKYFFSAFSVYIAIIIFSAVIIELIDPSIVNNKLSSMNIGIQNFVYLTGSVVQVIIFEFIPLTIMTVVILAFSKKLHIKNIIKPWNEIQRFVPLMIVITGIVSVFISNAGLFETILLYLSTIVLAYIYLRFGLLRAIFVSFISSIIDLASVIFSSNSIFSAAISIFIFIWAFAGLYTLTFFYISGKKKQEKDSEINSTEADKGTALESGPAENSKGRQKASPDELWIRCACPNCGNVEYRVNDDMSLKCTRCGQELNRDYSGPFNIFINDFSLHRNL